MIISADEFENLVADAIDELPKYTEHAKNVVITIDFEPSPEQRTKLNLMPGHSLFGLYEGIPLTRRTNNYSMVLPDKITIFQGPLQAYSPDITELKAQIKRTLWHELAHHYGLSHKDMENRMGES